MKLIQKVGVGIAAGVLAVGAGATAFAAGTSGSTAKGDGTGTGAKAAFVCAHLDEIEAQQSAHLDLLDGRLHLLQEAKDAATANGNDQAAAKIDQRIARTTARVAKVTARQGKLSTWATAHCTADGAPAAPAG
jgi:hypothetical protein